MDPIWAQVIVMGILVFITALYATFTYLSVRESKRSREDVWELEEERRKEERGRKEEKKMRIRGIIGEEILMNSKILKKINENITKKEFYLQHLLKREVKAKIPEDTAYESFIDDLGILRENEIKTIMYIYRELKEIGDKYRSIRDIQIQDIEHKLSQRIGVVSTLDELATQLEEEIPLIEKLCVKVYNLYGKLFNGQINEEKLEKDIKSLLDNYSSFFHS